MPARIRSHGFKFAVLGGLIALAIVMAALLSCRGKPTIAVNWTYIIQEDGRDKTVPVPEDVKYGLLLVVDGNGKDCPSDEELSTGKITAPIRMASVGDRLVGTSEFQFYGVPEDLSVGKYSFILLFRREDCSIQSYGCTAVNFEKHRAVSLRVEPAAEPNRGACNTKAGETCDFETAMCKGGEEADADPAESGTNECKLQLVDNTLGAADLSNAQEGTVSLSGPVAVATPAGFIIAYQEQGAKRRAVRQFVGFDGKKETVQADTLDNACPDDLNKGDRMTAAWNDTASSGLMVNSWPKCGDPDAGQERGAQFVGFNDHGRSTKQAPAGGLPGDGLLQRAGGLAATPGEGSFRLAGLYCSDGCEAFIHVINEDLVGAQDQGGPTFGSNSTFVRVAMADSIIAYAYSTKDGDNDTASLAVAPPGGNYRTISINPPDKATAVAAWSDRAAFFQPSTKAWGVFDADANTVAEGSFTASEVLGAAGITVINDHLILAAGSSAAIKLYLHDAATGTIGKEPKERVILPKTLGKTNLSAFDGTLMSIASGSGRVLVTWLNSPTGSSSSPVGGYAVLRCDG